MLEFFWILFFSKTVLLTPDYVVIDGGASGYELELKEPISAITAGASIQVDVSEMVLRGSGNDLLQVRRKISEMFPLGSIEATIEGAANSIRLTYTGHTAVNNDSARLLLTADSVPTGVEFHKLSVMTDVDLTRVKVYWRNYTE